MTNRLSLIIPTLFTLEVWSSLTVSCCLSRKLHTIIVLYNNPETKNLVLLAIVTHNTEWV